MRNQVKWKRFDGEDIQKFIRQLSTVGIPTIEGFSIHISNNDVKLKDATPRFTKKKKT